MEKISHGKNTGDNPPLDYVEKARIVHRNV
jgi:hypothetical protein